MRRFSREAELLELRDRREVCRDLDELIALIEAIDWRAVPTISTFDASHATRRLEIARNRVDPGGRP